MANRTSIRSRLGKLERQATPYRRRLSETEIVERFLYYVQDWNDADFMAFCEEFKTGVISSETLARMEREEAERRRRYYERC